VHFPCILVIWTTYLRRDMYGRFTSTFWSHEYSHMCGKKRAVGEKNYLCLLHADFFLTDTNLKRVVVFLNLINKRIKNELLFVHCPPHNLHIVQGRGMVVGVVTCYGMDGPGDRILMGGGDFLHPSKSALGPTHPPEHWTPGHSRV